VISSISSPGTSAVDAFSATGTAKPQATATASPKSDTVHLSRIAQAVSLEQQGMSVNAIAHELAMSVQQVQKYLGVAAQVTGAGQTTSDASVAAATNVNPSPNGPKA
jgi:DNA-binding NarL/FixJ family response regulator